MLKTPCWMFTCLCLDHSISKSHYAVDKKTSIRWSPSQHRTLGCCILSTWSVSSVKRSSRQRRSCLSQREELMQTRNAESRYWKWKDGITVHYAKAESKLPSDMAVVLLHGFGVASFHYESQFSPLSEAGYTVYAMDNVGAGLSWPDIDPAPNGPKELRNRPGSQWGFGTKVAEGFEDVVIGEALWVEQIATFISECVVERNVILAGNSLGGLFGSSCYGTDEGKIGQNLSPFGRKRWKGSKGLPWSTPLHFGAGYHASRRIHLYTIPFPGKVHCLFPRVWRNFTLPWYNTLRNPDSIEWLLNFVTANEAGVGHELPRAHCCNGRSSGRSCGLRSDHF